MKILNKKMMKAIGVAAALLIATLLILFLGPQNKTSGEDKKEITTNFSNTTSAITTIAPKETVLTTTTTTLISTTTMTTTTTSITTTTTTTTASTTIPITTTTTSTSTTTSITTAAPSITTMPEGDIIYIKKFNRGTYYAYGGPRNGGSGRNLIDCSMGDGTVKGSIASSYLYRNYGYNYNGKRTMVYLDILGYPTMSGFYYLDDCDAGNPEVIDFFYLTGSNCPFQTQGVVQVECYLVT